MPKFGLTQARYNQLMDTFNDEGYIEEVVNEWGVDTCNKGYGIFDHNGTGLLEVNKIDALWVFEDDSEAAEQAAKDGIKIIPVHELPNGFEFKYFGWIDTPENREAINRYTLGG